MHVPRPSDTTGRPRSFRGRLARFVSGVALPWLLLGSAFALGAAPAPGSGPDLEGKLKGVFLLNFAKLVEWPATAFRDATSPLRIGVLGDDTFGALLEDLFRGETARGRPVELRRGTSAAELGDCHLVYVAEKRTGPLRSQLGGLAGQPILTVGDDDGFIAAGGMIQFVREGRNLRFHINPDPASAVGLKISSRILALGKVTKAGGNP